MKNVEGTCDFKKVADTVELHCIMYPLTAVSISGGYIMCSHLWWQGCLFVNPAVPPLTAVFTPTATEGLECWIRANSGLEVQVFLFFFLLFVTSLESFRMMYAKSLAHSSTNRGTFLCS